MKFSILLLVFGCFLFMVIGCDSSSNTTKKKVSIKGPLINPAKSGKKKPVEGALFNPPFGDKTNSTKTTTPSEKVEGPKTGEGHRKDGLTGGKKKFLIQMDRGYSDIPFEMLFDFDYRIADFFGQPGTSEGKFEIPKEVLAFDDKKVVVEGFMMPVHFEEGKTKKFFLLNFRVGCCFGASPRLNEMILVTMKGEPVDVVPGFLPCRAYGTFYVGERTEEESFKTLYRIEADHFVESDF